MNSLSHTSHQSSNPSTDRFCPARASLECAIEQMQICMNKFPVIRRQMSEAAAPSAATRKTTPKRAKKAKDASTKQKRSKKQNSDEEIEVAVAPDATPAAASGVVQSPPRVDLDRNATQMRALLSLRPSSVVAASAASSYTPLHEPSSGTPASAPSQSSAAHAQQPAALGASAPSSQASGISAAAPFVAPHSQLGAASQASTQSLSTQLTPPPPPSIAPPSASGPTPPYDALSQQAQQGLSPGASQQAAGGVSHSPVLDEQSIRPEPTSSRHDHTKHIPPPPANGPSGTHFCPFVCVCVCVL